MVNQAAALDATFAALADATRRGILARLALGESSVSELARPLDMSLPAVLKHLGRLEEAGLLEATKDGRVRRCRLRPAPLREAGAWIDRYRRFWEERFDALDRYLQATEGKEKAWQPRKVERKRSGSRAPSRRRGTRSSRPGPRRWR